MGGLLAPGRGLRGALAWACAAIAAGLVAPVLTIAFLIVREVVVAPPFKPGQWWVFLHLWRPMAIGSLVLGPLLSLAPAALLIALVRRRNWPRPLADVAAGAVCGLLAVAAAIVLVRALGPLAEGS